MSITSGKVFVLTGLIALAAAACGREYPPWDGYPTSTGTSSGTGGQGGEMLTPEVEVFWCEHMLPNTPELYFPLHTGLLYGHGIASRSLWMPFVDVTADEDRTRSMQIIPRCLPQPTRAQRPSSTS